MKRALAAFLAITFSLLAMPAQAVEANYGYDISKPQCERVEPLPTPGPFSILGVNGGIVFSANPCLSTQLDWAGQAAQLYVNTGNPGPALSIRYTPGTAGGRTCDPAKDANSAGCAFVYGYRAAADSFAKAQTVFTEKGWTNLTNRTWWLDVETSNSWRGLRAETKIADGTLTETQAEALNVANIQGAVYYFESVKKVSRLGIYSTGYQWDLITGSTKLFSDHASWHSVGTDPESDAVAMCLDPVGFTGAPKTLVQYVDPTLELDVNVPCAITKANTVPAYIGVKTSKSSRYTTRYITLQASLKTVYKAPMANRRVNISFNGQVYRLTTNVNGVVSYKVRAPRSLGRYRVGVVYAGNELFKPASTSTTITISGN